MFDPSGLVPGARVRLPGDGEVVTLVQVEEGPFWGFVFRDARGGLDETTLTEDEIPGIEIVSSSTTPLFDGDPRAFRLGVEALRIENAFRHDMPGLAVSRISPLPHQLEAVYGVFLEEPVLRFLLADDPGAGKTIMAGLYIKELMLRRAADRVLIVTPANLRPQWQRELAERFGIHCVQFDASTFDASPTQNPWDLHDFVIVSRDWLKREEVLGAFAAADKRWDLAILDEAHGYTLQVDAAGRVNKRSERYRAAESVAERSHRLICLTATPHSGRNSSLWGLLRLVDRDAYGDVCPTGQIDLSPQHYRKVPKERMVDMAGNNLFRPRHPHTVGYELTGAERDLYEAVTRFVSTELARIRSSGTAGVAGFALTTMQRRLASSVRAIKRTLERRIGRLERALDDPEAYLRGRREFASLIHPEDPDSLADLDEEDRWGLEEQALDEWLPGTVAELQAELDVVRPLLTQAEETEAANTEVKLNELLGVLDDEGLRRNRAVKLLIFTEHRDTLDFLCERLTAEGFELAVIHGGLKLRDRIAAEKHFREHAQIMVATEAAGEGINLQFCHLMVNYDIPWNPNRLEQRMGRIHRIGQTRDVHIYNLVAMNTRESAVLLTLLHKLENMAGALGETVFDVIGEIFAGARLAELIEKVLVGEVTEQQAIEQLGGATLDPATEQKFRSLTTKALATHHLDWQAQVDSEARANERRLPPGYLERFFRDAVDFLGGSVIDRLDQTIRVARTPDHLVASSRLTGATREIFPSYERLTFDRAAALRAPAPIDGEATPDAELCGPGHPLFDATLASIVERTRGDVEAGTTFQSPDWVVPTIVFFVTADSIDGNGETVHRGFASITKTVGGTLESQRIFLYDLVDHAGEIPPIEVVGTDAVTSWARRHEFEHHYQRARADRDRSADIAENYLTKAFSVILSRHQESLFDLDAEIEQGVPSARGRLRQAELARAESEAKRDRRLEEVRRARNVRRGPVRLLARALVVPDDATDPSAADHEGSADKDAAYSSRQIEQIAVEVSRQYEIVTRGADIVRSVEADNVGFDLLSLKAAERRCIEVKGRAGIGSVALTWSEFAKAAELGDDYWLYVVLDCARAEPRLYRVRNPARALANDWASNLNVRFRVAPQPVIDAAESQP
jgi:superfamily II DNA or RNA helicase